MIETNSQVFEYIMLPMNRYLTLELFIETFILPITKNIQMFFSKLMIMQFDNSYFNEERRSH